MQVRALLFLFLSTFPILTFAQESKFCPDIRLDAAGKSMEKVPVRDQSMEVICFSMVAAQMADAYRFSHSPPKGDRRFDHQSSAYQLAVLGTVKKQALWEKAQLTDDPTEYEKLMLEMERMPFMQGGHVCPAFDIMKEYGSYKMLPAETSGLYGFTGPIYTEWLKYNSSDGPADIPALWEKSISESVDLVECNYLSQGLKISRDETKRALRDPSMAAILALGITQEKQKLSLNSSLSCQSSSIDSTPAAYQESIRDHFRRDNKQLQPMGLSICSRFLEADGGKNVADVLRAENGTWQGNKEDCRPHALLAIGMRKNPRNGNCEILLRNSWGMSEAGYSSDWEPEKGNIWVSEETLSKNIMDTQLLQ